MLASDYYSSNFVLFAYLSCVFLLEQLNGLKQILKQTLVSIVPLFIYRNLFGI